MRIKLVTVSIKLVTVGIKRVMGPLSTMSIIVGMSDPVATGRGPHPLTYDRNGRTERRVT